MQKYLAVLHPEYNQSNGKIPNCAKLVEAVEKAEERAKKMLETRANEGHAYGSPSTTVGSLTLAIRDAARKHRS